MRRMWIVILLLGSTVFAQVQIPKKREVLDVWTTPDVGCPYVNEKYNSSDFQLYLRFKGTSVTPATLFRNTFDEEVQSGMFVGIDCATVVYTKKSNYAAHLYCLPGFDEDYSNNYLSNPVLIGEPFDIADEIDVYKLLTDPKYKSFFSMDCVNLRTRGYDLFYLDFTQGGGDLHINAGLTLKILEWLNANTNGYFVVGNSFSGLAQRLALLYSMPENNTAKKDLTNKVRGYISIDVPHQGAAIGLDLQKALFTLTPNTAGYDFITAAIPDHRTQLNLPAFHQVLYEHAYQSGSDVSFNSQTYLKMYGLDGSLKRMGNYKRNVAMVSIAGSNFYVPNTWLLLRYNLPNRSRPDRVGMFFGCTNNQYAEMHAGGPEGSTAWHEYAPGSYGTWYYLPGITTGSPIPPCPSNQITFTVYQNGLNEYFKGTFIPIYSSLDIRPSINVFDPRTPPPSEEEILRNSPFDKIITGRVIDWIEPITEKILQDPNEVRYSHQEFGNKTNGEVKVDQTHQNVLAALDWLTYSYSRNPYSRVFSFNADNKSDLLFYEPSTKIIHVSTSTGGGFGGSGSKQWTSAGAMTGTNNNYLVGDYNGDGLMDITCLAPDNSIQVMLSNGSKFIPGGIGLQWVKPSGFGNNQGRHYVGDFNGDKKSDLLYFEPGNNSIHVTLSTGKEFGGPGSGMWVGPNGFGSLKTNYLPGDFNGDGKTDLAYLEADNTIHVCISTGSGLGGGESFLVSANAFGATNGRHYVGDFNGDCRDDLLYFDPTDNSISVSLSNGTSFNGSGSGKWIAANGFGSLKNNYFVGDYNGDGMIDLAYLESDNSIHVRWSTGKGFSVAGTGGQWVAPKGFGGTWGRHYPSYSTVTPIAEELTLTKLTIGSGKTATYVAGKQVSVKPETNFQKGSEVRLYIDPSVSR